MIDTRLGKRKKTHPKTTTKCCVDAV